MLQASQGGTRGCFFRSFPRLEYGDSQEPARPLEEVLSRGSEAGGGRCFVPQEADRLCVCQSWRETEGAESKAREEQKVQSPSAK